MALATCLKVEQQERHINAQKWVNIGNNFDVKTITATTWKVMGERHWRGLVQSHLLGFSYANNHVSTPHIQAVAVVVVVHLHLMLQFKARLEWCSVPVSVLAASSLLRSRTGNLWLVQELCVPVTTDDWWPLCPPCRYFYRVVQSVQILVLKRLVFFIYEYHEICL